MFSDAVLNTTEHKILAKRRFCIWFRQNISAFRDITEHGHQSGKVSYVALHIT